MGAGNWATVAVINWPDCNAALAPRGKKGHGEDEEKEAKFPWPGKNTMTLDDIRPSLFSFSSLLRERAPKWALSIRKGEMAITTFWLGYRLCCTLTMNIYLTV